MKKRRMQMHASFLKHNRKEYFTFNAHGDVIGLTDSTGALTQSYHYDAFGVERDPREDDPNPYRYAGEYLDRVTGDIYLRARYYNPSIGRFSAQDAVSRVTRGMPSGQELPDPLSLNLYTYCYNSPLMYTDPSGNSAVAASASALALLVAQYGPQIEQAAYNLGISVSQFVTMYGPIIAEYGPAAFDAISSAVDRGADNVVQFVTSALSANRKKPVNLPSPKKIKINMDHIMSGHGPNGNRGGPNKTRFPWWMTAKDIENAIREAYQYGGKVKTGVETMVIHGPWKGYIIEIILNIESNTIVTAYPKY